MTPTPIRCCPVVRSPRVLDAYTTTDNYPYSQNVDTSSLPANSGLNQNLNYVRNSVKVVVNAYSGKMTSSYDVTGLTKTKDPILQTGRRSSPACSSPCRRCPRPSRPISATPKTCCRSRPRPTVVTT